MPASDPGTVPPWQPLLAEARARTAAFTEGGSSQSLLADDTLRLAEQLWTAARDPSGDVPIEAAVAVADLYWRRSQARSRPPAEDDDLGAAIAVYALIAAADEDRVPEILRADVAEARAILGAPAPRPAWDLRDVDVAVRQLTQAEADDDDGMLGQAITRFRALLRQVPEGAVDAAGNPVESVILSNLGLALRLHGLRTGACGELDEAVDLTRRALSGGTADHSRADALIRPESTCRGPASGRFKTRLTC